MTLEPFLQGKVAVITGGARGIGAGIARQLQARGAKIVIWDILTSVADDLQPDLVCVADVANYASVEHACASTLETMGTIDILVNNAGINGPVLPITDYPLAEFDRVISVDLAGVFHCTQVVLKHMRSLKQGRIINIASIAGKEGVPGIAPYSAAKGGVIAFTKAVAKEVVTEGILVNCIAPSLVETDLFDEMTQDHIANMRAKIPMGRILRIEEVAKMVAWIAGPECTFTTGFAFDLTGGRATY